MRGSLRQRQWHEEADRLPGRAGAGSDGRRHPRLWHAAVLRLGPGRGAADQCGHVPGYGVWHPRPLSQQCGVGDRQSGARSYAQVQGQHRPVSVAAGAERGQPATFLGYGITEAEDMPGVAANAFPVAFGDFKEGYLICDKVGMRITRDEITTPGFVKFYVRKRVGGSCATRRPSAAEDRHRLIIVNPASGLHTGPLCISEKHRALDCNEGFRGPTAAVSSRSSRRVRRSRLRMRISSACRPKRAGRKTRTSRPRTKRVRAHPRPSKPWACAAQPRQLPSLCRSLRRSCTCASTPATRIP